MNRIVRLVLIWLALAPGVPAFSKRPISFDDLMKVRRISDPEISPDGRSVAYVQGTVDFDANKISRHIWLIPAEGGEPRQLTEGEGSDTRPRWSPDGRTIAFVSTRGGKSQIWTIPVSGGEAHRLTNLSTEAERVVWSRRGHWLLFTSQVYPDCPSDECNRNRLADFEKSKVKARLIDELLFRHWDSWRERRYTHLFAVSDEGGEPRDLTPGAFDSPTFFLDAPDAYDISPDGAEVCFTSNRTGHPAWTTNNDLYLVPVQGGELRDITSDNPGSDAFPVYSPNGRYIAYTSQARNGYESDLFRLRVYDRATGKMAQLTPGPNGPIAFDQWVVNIAWAPDNDTIYFTAPERARQPIFRTSVTNPGVEKAAEGSYGELAVTPDGQWLISSRSSLNQPAELYRVAASGGEAIQLTHANHALIAGLDLSPAESVTTGGALGAEIHSLLAKPPGFDANKKYPALLLIHGGPQSAWEDAWGYRWNAQLFASHGYVVLMPNPHGSVGYGQKFVEEISGDWGGAPFQDLMDATNQLESLPYVDRRRIGAAGASFGGFMIDWIAGHTDRFKALVSHDGVYDQLSMYGETEELWFPEWEFKGVPWVHRELYEKWSPSNFVQNVRTPVLLIQGELDFRVPNSQAFQFFTALQRRGVPSKLLYFPDEGHWVLKPQNSQLWYQTVLGWLDQYLKP